MSNIKKISKAEALELSKKLPNQLGVHPLSFPYVAQSIAENPLCWVELPVSEQVCRDIACGFAIKHPIGGFEYEIIHGSSNLEMVLIKNFISHLSSHATVRFFKHNSGRLFLCTDADTATIGSALHNAVKELFCFIPSFCIAEITE